MLVENRFLGAKIDVGRTNQEVIGIIWVRDDGYSNQLSGEIVEKCLDFGHTENRANEIS